MKWVRNRFRQFTGFLVFFSKNIDGYEINVFHLTCSPLMFNRRLHRLWSILNPKWDNYHPLCDNLFQYQSTINFTYFLFVSVICVQILHIRAKSYNF